MSIDDRMGRDDKVAGAYDADSSSSGPLGSGGDNEKRFCGWCGVTTDHHTAEHAEATVHRSSLPTRSGGDEREIEAVARALERTGMPPKAAEQWARVIVDDLARVRGVRDDNEGECTCPLTNGTDYEPHEPGCPKARRRSPQDEDESAWIARAIDWMRSEQREILARGDGRELASTADAARQRIINDLLKDAPVQ